MHRLSDLTAAGAAGSREVAPAEGLLQRAAEGHVFGVVRESVACVPAEIMEAEVAGQIGAGPGEVSPERVTQRNAYRPRPWDTRARAIELASPTLRHGLVLPELSAPAQAC